MTAREGEKLPDGRAHRNVLTAEEARKKRASAIKLTTHLAELIKNGSRQINFTLNRAGTSAQTLNSANAWLLVFFINVLSRGALAGQLFPNVDEADDTIFPDGAYTRSSDAVFELHDSLCGALARHVDGLSGDVSYALSIALPRDAAAPKAAAEDPDDEEDPSSGVFSASSSSSAEDGAAAAAASAHSAAASPARSTRSQTGATSAADVTDSGHKRGRSSGRAQAAEVEFGWASWCGGGRAASR